MDAILFLIFAAIAVGCGVNLVVQRHPISSALSLVGVMAALAVLYLLLGAEFMAAAQMIVYAGAIMVLFVFTIMLLNAGSERKTDKALFARLFGVPALIGFIVLIGFLIRTLLPKTENVVFGTFTEGTARGVGLKLFTEYLLPFEVTSLLILIAILGAVVLARKEI
ncbi:MAG: NADH-quinone oxidoreductase subunit J [Bryobacteraceae bacterium]|nr:NADH-quinone oxidoreductase subunit J [Bryobacteraceae bacterium]MDW8379257.1 NADH-quinone oxidoreductase subunit J [Bryobacterales bacterium]